MTEKTTPPANTLPLFIISGRIESAEQVAVSRQDNFPIIHTLIKGRAADEFRCAFTFGMDLCFPQGKFFWRCRSEKIPLLFLRR